MDGEAITLREAIIQVKRLGYYGVSFYGDAKEIYQKLSNKDSRSGVQGWKHHELTIYLKDICSMAESRIYYSFRLIKTDENDDADCLAKHARSTTQPYIVFWC